MCLRIGANVGCRNESGKKYKCSALHRDSCLKLTTNFVGLTYEKE
jgi:hypothetical protein